MAGGCSGGAHHWILPSLRHEAAIDDDDPAGCELGWREYPIAGSGHVAAQGRATGVNECFRARHERGRELHATEFVVCSRKAPPALARRQIAGGAERRCSRVSISASFQALRWRCQVPEPTKVAVAASAKMAGTGRPGRSRRASAAFTALRRR